MNIHKKLRADIEQKSQKGQALIIIAVAFLALVAFIGLAVDVGRMFIAYGDLRRGADAAALAAAAQFREGRSEAEMSAAARDVMHLNGIDPLSINIETCDYTQPLGSQDPQLCTQPYHSKKVRITVEAMTEMTFMRVVGWNNITLSSSSVSEAASMDVVLVLDISDSMVWDAAPGSSLRDPSVCNNETTYPGSEDAGEYLPNFSGGFKGECHPFEEVKHSASEFVMHILDKSASEEEDRIAIVTFGNGWNTYTDTAGINKGTHYRPNGTYHWTSDQAEALSIINDLKVFEPDTCREPPGLGPPWHTYYGPCLLYTDTLAVPPPPAIPPTPVYQGFYCASCTDSNDYSSLPTTNLGGGLRRAGVMYNYETREEALWVVVVLTDGIANTTDTTTGDDIANFATYPLGFCPNPSDPVLPRCQDKDVTTRHADTNALYDADDYARDMADYLGCYPGDSSVTCSAALDDRVGAVVFTIGLGDDVVDNTNEVNGLPFGASLLRYIAAVGYDGDPGTDSCSDLYDTPAEWEEWCGNYYFAPVGNELVEVFEDIASRIFTRLTY